MELLKIPIDLHIRWVLMALAQIPLRIVAFVAAPIAVALQEYPDHKVWPWLFPFDHAMTGKPPAKVEGQPDPDPRTHADPMWWRWWHTDEGDRAWYCTLLKRFDINDCGHWAVRLLQLWRNGGAGFNYLTAGVDVRDCVVIEYVITGGKLYLAFFKGDVGYDTMTEAPYAKPRSVPCAYYESMDDDSKRGWRLNRPIGGRCKWIWRW